MIFATNHFVTLAALINLLGFTLMYIDKIRAINKKWRISENTLMLVSILGGSIGSYFGLKLFRHKTKHIKFSIGIPIIIIIQIFIITSYPNFSIK